MCTSYLDRSNLNGKSFKKFIELGRFYARDCPEYTEIIQFFQQDIRRYLTERRDTRKQ